MKVYIVESRIDETVEKVFAKEQDAIDYCRASKDKNDLAYGEWEVTQ